jgi:hypothetical protein
MEVDLAPGRVAGLTEVVEAASVCITIVLVGGVVVVDNICTFDGVKLQLASTERPEQESVINMGAVNAEVNSTEGAMVTVADPASPGVSVMTFPARVIPEAAGETATVNSHCVATLTATAGVDVEV